MVCANPDCRLESSHLRDGSLYLIDRNAIGDGRTGRHYIWLCGHCAKKFIVQTWRPPGSQLRPTQWAEAGKKRSHPYSLGASQSGLR